MGKVLVELGGLQQRLSTGSRHALLGTGSVHASTIEGGRELSSYPDRCLLRLERRTVPPETAADVAGEFEQIVAQLSADDPTFRASSKATFVRNPWQADTASDIVTTAAAAIQAVTGAPAETMTQTGWLDSALLGGAGIPTVICGPCGEGLHAAVRVGGRGFAGNVRRDLRGDHRAVLRMTAGRSPGCGTPLAVAQPFRAAKSQG